MKIIITETKDRTHKQSMRFFCLLYCRKPTLSEVCWASRAAVTSFITPRTRTMWKQQWHSVWWDLMMALWDWARLYVRWAALSVNSWSRVCKKKTGRGCIMQRRKLQQRRRRRRRDGEGFGKDWKSAWWSRKVWHMPQANFRLTNCQELLQFFSQKGGGGCPVPHTCIFR